MMVTADV